MNALHAIAFATLLTGQAAAQNFVLDISDGANVPVPAARLIPVHVAYLGSDAAVKGFKVFASRFASDQESIAVEILRDCDDHAKAEAQPVAFELPEGKIASFCLRVGELTGDSKYTGMLTLIPDNGKPETAKKFTLTRAVNPSPTLSTDHLAITIDVERPLEALFAGFEVPFGSVVLQEKSGKGFAKSVTVQTDSTLKGPGSFDPVTNLDFKWNGDPWEKPFSTIEPDPEKKSRGLSAGSQAEISIIGKNLQPGEYVIPLRFAAQNATTDSAKFSITAHVHDPLAFAVGALLISLILSLIITKMLTGKRRRLNLLNQIRGLRLSKGNTLPNLPSVVWVDAVLHLAARLSARFWLTGADVIDGQVDSVRGTVAVLRQARELRARLEQHLPQLISERAAQAIERVLAELESGAPDDAMAARIKTELDAFENWLQPGAYPAALWNAIRPALENLRREINAVGVPGAATDPIQQLKVALDAAVLTAPQTAETVEESYRGYARLRILWDCRNDAAVFAALTTTPEPDLVQCFRLNDDLAWKQLKEKSAGLKIVMPRSSDPDGIESFTPISFSVTSDDPTVVGSYLFHCKVQFAWKLTLKRGPDRLRDSPRGDKQKDVVLAPTTLGPSVVQYFPNRGTVTVSVTLTYGGDSIPMGETPGPVIVDSGDFGSLKAFEGVEYVSWTIAAVVALATGLSTFYYKNPTFGSFQDYLTLMLWGVGMDQGKNFLQALQSVSSQPAAPQTTH